MADEGDVFAAGTDCRMVRTSSGERILDGERSRSTCWSLREKKWSSDPASEGWGNYMPFWDCDAKRNSVHPASSVRPSAGGGTALRWGVD